MNAVLLISHGSKSKELKREVSVLVQKLREMCDVNIFEFAFLEITEPSIEEGIDICVEKGAKKIIVLLNFLNSGRHVDVDIPAIIEKSKSKHKETSIHITRPVGQHERIADLFSDMVSKSIAQS